MRKRKHDEEHVNHERWLLTYSDLITLLMIFFIILYTISNVNNRKFSDLAQALSTVFGENHGAVMGESSQPLPLGGSKKEQVQMQKLQKEIEKFINEKGIGDKVTVTIEERGLVVSLREKILFPLGSAEINDDGKLVIKTIGEFFSTMPNHIRIEGHTDNLPIKTAQFPSNWELSTARSTNVVRYLVDSAHLNPVRLSATGYGEFKPKFPNTAKGNPLNRRVDMVLLKNILEISEPGAQQKIVVIPETNKLDELSGEQNQ